MTIPEDQIRTLAHELWQQDGCPDGKDLCHWLAAETILRQAISAPIEHAEPDLADFVAADKGAVGETVPRDAVSPSVAEDQAVPPKKATSKPKSPPKAKAPAKPKAEAKPKAPRKTKKTSANEL
jgi:Protein of unknown function (DUF2934)